MWAGHRRRLIIVGCDGQEVIVLADGGIIVIISAQKAPLPPRKKYKGRGDSSAGRRHAGTGAVGVVGSRFVLRLFRRGFREAGATAAAVLVALKTAADCKNLGLSQSGPPSVVCPENSALKAKVPPLLLQYIMNE